MCMCVYACICSLLSMQRMALVVVLMNIWSYGVCGCACAQYYLFYTWISTITIQITVKFLHWMLTWIMHFIWRALQYLLFAYVCVCLQTQSASPMRENMICDKHSVSDKYTNTNKQLQLLLYKYGIWIILFTKF